MSKKMSINVTINGNPVCVRPSKMVLSDLEQIKKNERERRKRLRLEQVRQQSKELSSKVLKRAKSAAKKELHKLERDCKSEMRKMHDMKIMEIQRKYQEDMEDIGLAHSAAALQPDVDAIIALDQHNNRTAAAERGKEAMQLLKESAQKEDPAAVHNERLRQVREVENVRSSMISKLPDKLHPPTESLNETDSSEEGGIVEEKTIQVAPKRKRSKKLVGKKSPAKVVSKSNVKVVGQNQKPKSPRRITVEVHAGNAKSPKRTVSSRSRKTNGAVADNSDNSDNAGKSTVAIGTEVPCTNVRCNGDADDHQEPRKTVPTIKLTPTKADKVARYNPEDYKQKTSESNSSSSSSVSDDSSYFSDGCGEFLLSKTTSKQHKSAGSGKVQLYDHCTRQRNFYDQPIGLVERIDIRNEPNAVDAACEIINAERLAAISLESRRLTAERRGTDAVLRERVRRDYGEMIRNFENIARNERVARSTVCSNRHTVQLRRKTCQTDDHGSVESVCNIILHDTNQPGPSRVQESDERVRKSSRDNRERATICTHAARQENPTYERPQCCERHDNTEEILEAWRKIEQQKRLLLREFGCDLPSTIFNASMTRLFDSRQATQSDQQPAQQPAAAPSIPVQPSPEIKIINMSSSEDNAKKAGASKKKSKKATKAPIARTTETAVQTSTMDEIGAAKDKSVQVEIRTEESRETRRRSDDSPHDGTGESDALQYVEPRVIVLTPPEVCDTSSGSSVSRDIIIELDNHQVKVTPRKRKSSSEKSSKRESSTSTHTKPRSLPSSQPGSPTKRHPASAPSSRSGSPKKRDNGRPARSRSPDNVVDIVVNKGSVKVQAGPSRPIEIIHDSSVGSSVPDTTLEQSKEHSVTSGKPYRIIKHPTVKKVAETSRDTSDTSTSYASLPAKMSPIVPLSRHQITPILEMLDLSTNERIRAARVNVSPVSTPETPSPRIMNVPSNRPHPERIARILRFHNLTGTGTTAADSTLHSSMQNERSSSTNPSHSQNRDQRPANDSRTMNSRRSGNTSDYCTCANPTCQLLHDNINYIRDYATANHPEVLEKYEDLQNVCTERIASLTELIQRVRNEQRGMEFSMISPADETSLMQLPPPRPFCSDFQSVQRLVESVEAIHSKLAKTLRESQKIITNSTAQVTQASPNPEVQASSTSYESKSKGSASTSTEETPVPVASSKTKPRVISNEPVKIDIDRLKRGRGPYTTMFVTAENPSRSSPETPRHHEEIVAKLYQEILEQSKNVNNSRESDSSLSRQRTPSPPQNIASSRKQNSPKVVTEDEVTKDECPCPQPKKDEEYVPLLAGIPKNPRALPSVPPGTRLRPPPAGRPYRSEINSPVHELSTIVEFDTPDTVNRSQGSTRSPNGKSRRTLQLQSPTKTASGTNREKENANTQTGPSEQSVDVAGAPLITENMLRTIPRRLTMRDVGSPDEKFVINSDTDRAVWERGTTKSLLSQGPSTSIEGSASRNNDDGKSVDGVANGRTDCDVEHRRCEDELAKRETSEALDENIAELLANKLKLDSGLGHGNKNEKLMSTSSNSFSGLSGISEIISSPNSELAKWASSSEEIETALKKMGLGWAISTLKKTREASALSSSSNSDRTPINVPRRTKSPSKKPSNDDNLCGLPDFSDVSSISIKEASKSTERAVLMKARTSTPNIQNSNSTSEKSVSATTSSSGISVQDHSDTLTAPNLSLNNNKR